MKCAVYMFTSGTLLLAFLRISDAQAAAGGNQCFVKFKDNYNVSETTPIGTNVMEIPADAGVNWTMQINYDLLPADQVGQLDSHFVLQQPGGNNYVLTVNKDLDLEDLYFKLETNVIQLRLTCTQPGIPDQARGVFVVIEPVNEYSPEFVNAPFIIDIGEDEAVHYPIITLNSKVRDRDIRPSTGEIYGFSLKPYDFARYGGRPEDDGRDYFIMANVQKGSVAIGRKLDYETLALANRTTLWLNVTVTDYSGSSNWTTVQVNVQDADDLSPEFYAEGLCQPQPLKFPPCLVTYRAKVPRNAIGEVHQIDPAPIYAHDRDTLDNPVKYTLRDISGGPGVADHLHVDELTGALTVVQPFPDIREYSLYVEAQETAGNMFKQSATLIVDVYDPPTTSTEGTATAVTKPGSRHDGDDEDSEESKDGQKMDKVPMIGMAVLGALALALVVALFFACLKLRKLREARVGTADTSTRSTKSLVNDEELPSASSPALQHKQQDDLLNNLPELSERGNRLPPLHPGMFDGTRSFDKSGNADFFKTPGKVKVPLAPSDGQTGMAEPIYIDDDNVSM